MTYSKQFCMQCGWYQTTQVFMDYLLPMPQCHVHGGHSKDSTIKQASYSYRRTLSSLSNLSGVSFSAEDIDLQAILDESHPEDEAAAEAARQVTQTATEQGAQPFEIPVTPEHVLITNDNTRTGFTGVKHVNNLAHMAASDTLASVTVGSEHETVVPDTSNLTTTILECHAGSIIKDSHDQKVQRELVHWR
jgi:hypothetical protein